MFRGVTCLGTRMSWHSGSLFCEAPKSRPEEAGSDVAERVPPDLRPAEIVLAMMLSSRRYLRNNC